MKSLQRINYESIKNELIKSGESIKYFSFKWYQQFEGIFYKVIKNQDNSYYQELFNTDFYVKNGCGYCVFLEIFYRNNKSAFLEA